MGPNRRPAVAGALVFLLAGASARGARAQSAGFSLEAGTGATEWEAQPSRTVVSVAPGVWWENGWSRLRAEAVYSAQADQGWALDGGMNGALLLPSLGPLRPEIGALADWSGYQYYRGSQLLQASGRLYAGAGARGAWIGAGLGRASNRGIHNSLVHLESGVWGRVGPFDLRVTLSRTSFQDSTPGERITVDSGGGFAVTPSRRFLRSYSDAWAAVQWHTRWVELDAGVGQRFGQPEFVATSWFTSAALHLTGLADLVAAFGRYPSDVAAYRLGGRYATVSLRVRMPVASSGAAYGTTPAARAASAFQLQPTAPGRYRLAIEAPGAGQVEIMGDFSEWQPLELAPEGAGRWTVLLALTPGLHRINVRIDGGTWTVPAGTAPVEDEFAGRVGVFVVE